MKGRIETSPIVGAQVVVSARRRWSELWPIAELRDAGRHASSSSGWTAGSNVLSRWPKAHPLWPPTAIPAPRRASPSGCGRTPPPTSLPMQQGFELWPWVAGLMMVRTRTAGRKLGTRRTWQNCSGKSYDSSNTTRGRWRSDWRPLKLQVNLSYSHLENNWKPD
jgi:hypothetical protein